jgi:uncharacterized protein YjdB
MHPNPSGLLRPIQRAVAAVALAAAALACGSDSTTNVTPGPEIGVTPASATIAVGDSVKITVILPPALASNGATYVSNNTSVAITRTNGWVIGVGRGNTNITVTSIADTRLSTPFSLSVTP